ncbi:MAG: hypothetical protein ACYC63_11665 [Armatimonadota bacterium]
MAEGFSEDDLRDFVAARIEGFTDLIQDYEGLVQRTGEERERLLATSPEDVEDKPRHLLQLIYKSRMHRGLEALRELALVDTEYQLLSTGTSGKQPSADILALSPETGLMVLLELKVSDKTERQAVTELSQYSWGLTGRFLGAGPVDVTWLPISTEWRVTLRSAIAYQMIWANRAVLPFKARVTVQDAHITNVTLEAVDLMPELTEPASAAVFAMDTLDGLVISLTEEPVEPRFIMDFIVASASRLGYSGFALYTEASDGMYPYEFVIATFNPYKCFLKARNLEKALKLKGLSAMRAQVRQRVWEFLDYDLRTQQVIEHDCVTGPEEDVENCAACGGTPFTAQYLALAAQNRLSELFGPIKERLDQIRSGEYTLSGVDVPGLLWPAGISFLGEVKHVCYFGLLQEGAFERLLWEFHHLTEAGDGPVLDDIGADPFRAYGTMYFFDRLMDELNYVDWGEDDESNQDC